MTRIYTNAVSKVLNLNHRICTKSKSKKGMELVQVGILIAIAVGIGLIFKDKIGSFVNNTFSALLDAKFS